MDASAFDDYGNKCQILSNNFFRFSSYSSSVITPFFLNSANFKRRSSGDSTSTECFLWGFWIGSLPNLFGPRVPLIHPNTTNSAKAIRILIVGIPSSILQSMTHQPDKLRSCKRRTLTGNVNSVAGRNRRNSMNLDWLVPESWADLKSVDTPMRSKVHPMYIPNETSQYSRLGERPDRVKKLCRKVWTADFSLISCICFRFASGLKHRRTGESPVEPVSRLSPSKRAGGRGGR